MNKLRLTLTVVLSIFSCNSFSESIDDNKNRVISKKIGFVLNSMRLNDETAIKNNLGNKMQSYGVYGQVERSNGLLLGAGLGFLDFDDHGEYEVAVSYGGSNSYFGEDATAQGFNFYGYAGYQHRIKNFGADVTTGFELIRAERTVTNCSDCPSEDLDIDAGLYIKPRVGYKFGETWGLDLTYTYYVNSDIDNNIGLEFTLIR